MAHPVVLPHRGAPGGAAPRCGSRCCRWCQIVRFSQLRARPVSRPAPRRPPRLRLASSRGGCRLSQSYGDGERSEPAKPKFPQTSRFSARTPQNCAPIAESNSAGKIGPESGLGSARGPAKVCRPEKGHGLPPAALKAVLPAGAGFFIPKRLEPESGSSGSAS